LISEETPAVQSKERPGEVIGSFLSEVGDIPVLLPVNYVRIGSIGAGLRRLTSLWSWALIEWENLI
jgi:hypothetical protein